MRQNYRFLLLATFGLLGCSTIEAAGPSLLNRMADERRPIVVHNRILAKVHGKAISVVDVQKKMDVVFFRRFAEYANSPSTRHQFYTINWRPVLNDLIDKELILFDAKESKVEVSKGDVRQELEELFGPNIVSNLDKIGIGYDEAKTMIEGDLMIRRMMSMRVHMKAHGRITPREIRKTYQEFCEKHKRPTEWTYQVVTVRNPDPAKGLAAAEILRNLLSGGETSMEQLAESYQLIEAIDPETKVAFSEEYKHKEEEASESYREVLKDLSANSYSTPIAQQSRGKTSVHRIFFLKEMTPGGTIPLAEIENELHHTLMGKAIAEETESYLAKLRKNAGLTQEKLEQLVPTNFEPFSLH
ncbi:MAG: hypothetical protein Q8K75_06050 [Chlamydiales bacterium]|nr:hypothetical protein [Chlamydiales bacterium]